MVNKSLKVVSIEAAAVVGVEAKVGVVKDLPIIITTTSTIITSIEAIATIARKSEKSENAKERNERKRERNVAKVLLLSVGY